MMNEIVLHQDDLYKLTITRNGHEGILVQLTSFIRKSLPNSDNDLEEHRSSHVEFMRDIKIRHDNKLNQNFKIDLAAAIKQANVQLILLQENHTHIEGALRDYAVQVSK